MKIEDLIDKLKIQAEKTPGIEVNVEIELSVLDELKDSQFCVTLPNFLISVNDYGVGLIPYVITK